MSDWPMYLPDCWALLDRKEIDLKSCRQTWLDIKSVLTREEVQRRFDAAGKHIVLVDEGWRGEPMFPEKNTGTDVSSLDPNFLYEVVQTTEGPKLQAIGAWKVHYMFDGEPSDYGKATCPHCGSVTGPFSYNMSSVPSPPRPGRMKCTSCNRVSEVRG